MKYTLILLFTLITAASFSQVKGLKLRNAVIVGQFDKVEDRFTIESTVVSILSDFKVKTTPSVNYVRAGESPSVLVGDSLNAILKEKGFDTYIIVSVRGYDRKYKVSQLRPTFQEKLDQGTLREIYRNAAVSVTFEFAFYRDGNLVGIDQFTCGNISDRESTMKRFVKQLVKRVEKKWLN